MPNKKIKKRKLNFRGAVKTSLATILAATMGLTSGVAFTALNGGLRTSAYLRDGNPLEQTRQMMDGNNFLVNNSWMHAVFKATGVFPETYSVDLSFAIPDYDMKKLSVVIKDRSNASVGEYQFTETSPTTISLSNLTQSVYDVSVYEGNSSEGKFICKSEFSPVNQYGFGSSSNVNLLDSDGNPVVINGTQQILKVYGPTEAAGNYVVRFDFPFVLIPYDTHTVKVVFFESEADRNGAPVDVAASLYDYVWKLPYSDNADFYFLAKIGIGAPNKTYEAHFYKDEVKQKNFMCKAVNIKFNS